MGSSEISRKKESTTVIVSFTNISKHLQPMCQALGGYKEENNPSLPAKTSQLKGIKQTFLWLMLQGCK